MVTKQDLQESNQFREKLEVANSNRVQLEREVNLLQSKLTTAQKDVQLAESRAYNLQRQLTRSATRENDQCKRADMSEMKLATMKADLQQSVSSEKQLQNEVIQSTTNATEQKQNIANLRRKVTNLSKVIRECVHTYHLLITISFALSLHHPKHRRIQNYNERFPNKTK